MWMDMVSETTVKKAQRHVKEAAERGVGLVYGGGAVARWTTASALYGSGEAAAAVSLVLLQIACLFFFLLER